MSLPSIEITRAEVKERARIAALKPVEKDFVGRKGYRRKYRPDGTYEWRYKFKPNDGHGKMTSAAQEVGEMMTPFNAASLEHQARQSAKVERDTLRDGEGRTHFVESAQADRVARQNGWGHHWRVRGAYRVERGLDGMLWRWWRGEWEPTGRVGASLLSDEVPLKGVQRDPEGHPWRATAEGWERVE